RISCRGNCDILTSHDFNSDLKRHRQVHSSEKPYKCELREYRCAMKANLKFHLQLKHSAAQNATSSTPQKLYSCSSKGALKIHEHVHSDECPFKCKHCSFASKQRSNFLIHRRNCHVEKPLGSRYRARLEAARAFHCDICKALFVREDSLRSHKRQHNSNMQQQSQTPTSVTTNTPSSYSATHLKIIMVPSKGPEATFVQASAGKAGAILLGPEDHNVPLNAVIQHVNMLAPESGLEHQTVLLTQIDSSETTSQTGTQNFIASCSESTSDGTHTSITSCSDLESLHKLIQEGRTEVVVVTEANLTIANTKEPMNIDGSSSQDVSNLPLSISTWDQQANKYHLSPHHLFSDSSMEDISDS
uniref:Zinc finger protein 64 homolog (mouse) n=1 Tax=Cyprinus carpio TaxID=7962 RepID=A0A8C2BY88_CYPCA